MPKYTTDIIAGYSLYFTSKCVIEAMHVHASNVEMKESGSAKLWVYKNGDTKIQEWGILNKYEMKQVQRYIKNNYKVMYKRWKRYSDNDFYNKR